MLTVAATSGLFFLAVMVAGPVLLPASLGSPLHRVAAGVAAAIVVIYLWGMGVFATGLPPWMSLLVFPGAAILGWKRRSMIHELWQDRELRLSAWAAAAVGSGLLGWQFLVNSYSGGTWAGDHWEHYQRAHFFAHQLPLDTTFLGIYSLAARPPLVNVFVSVFPYGDGQGFFVFQTIMVLLGATAIWPVLLLQKYFQQPGRQLQPAWTALLLLCLPAFVQQATYPWTKLVAASFVLLGIALLLPREATWRQRLAGGLALAAGVLAHYSAAPWTIGIIAGLAMGGRLPLHPRAVREHLLIAGCAALLMATWVGWAVMTLGWADTFASNTTVTSGEGLSWGIRGRFFLLNIWLAIMPVPFRTVDLGVFAATDPLAYLRDTFFTLYQSNVIAMAGSTGVVLAGWLMGRSEKGQSPAADWRFWGPLIAISLGVGTFAHTEYVALGLAHIGFLPLPLILVAWLAARAPGDRLIRRLLLVGISFDFALGILLHFSLQSFLPLRWMYPYYPEYDLVHQLGLTSRLNWEGKQNEGMPYLADLTGSLPIAALLLGTALVFLRVSAQRSPDPIKT